MGQPAIPPDNQTYYLKPMGGLVSNRTLLSCSSDGSRVDLCETDDESGRQRWKFQRVYGDCYHFIVEGGISDISGSTWVASAPGEGHRYKKEYLSCSKDGRVDLWHEDDRSGRQRWRLVPIENYVDSASFNIVVAGDTNSDKKYLSCSQDGLVVDLYDKDDDSGRQQWQLISPPTGQEKFDNYTIGKGVKFVETTVSSGIENIKGGVKMVAEVGDFFVNAATSIFKAFK